MRVLITGSRDWTDVDVISDALWEYRGQPGDYPTLVTGACPTGADAIAERIASNNLWEIEEHPADWSGGRGAGPLRNKHMVDLGADVCLAFIGHCTSPRCHIDGRHPSHGATGCADLAEAAGIPTKRHYEEH